VRFYEKLSFQKKLLLFLISIVILMGGMMGLLIRFVIFPHLTREMESRGISVAHRLAESARTFILTRDTVRLTTLLFDEKRYEKNIAYILVTDEDNRVLAHTFVGSLPGSDQAVHAGPDSSTASSLTPAAFAGAAHVSDIVVPVYEGLYQIGTIRVGLDKRFINSVTRKLSLFHLGFIGFITLVGLLFGLFLSRFITRPITSLTTLAEEISTGNLDTRINFSSREQCWEFSACETKECPAYGNEKLRCWFVDHTLCKGTCSSRFPEKLDECKDCPVYKSQVGDEIVQLADAFNHMTQRLQASETELRRSEEKYRFLFNNDPSPIFLIDLDSYGILDANDRAVEKYGYPKELLVGMKFLDLGFQEEAPEIMSALSSIDHNQKPCSFVARARHRRQNGDTFWVNINLCCFRYLGRPGAIATATDISEIVDAETKLIQAGKMATLGEMSAGVAHELNQPLNAIKLGSEFLHMMTQQGKVIPDKDLLEVTAEISEQVDRAAGIITHLRDFGRKSDITRELIDINRPIQGVFTVLGQQLKVHGIEVRMDLDETLPLILADENRIEQVLINLVNNARDAMEAKTRLGVSTDASILTVKSFQEDDRVVVSVNDTGMGIPKPVRERMYEPFFTTKEIGKGTGLGLSISYSIVRDYEGTIDFATEEGVGTTFTVSFPRASQEI
jgi:histidine kinase